MFGIKCFIFSYSVFVSCTSKVTLSAELMMVEEYFKLMLRRLRPYCVLELERKVFWVPQNGITNILSIKFITLVFTNDNNGNIQTLAYYCKEMEQKTEQNEIHQYNDAENIYYIIYYFIRHNASHSGWRKFVCWYSFTLVDDTAEQRKKLLRDFIDAHWHHIEWKKSIGEPRNCS